MKNVIRVALLLVTPAVCGSEAVGQTGVARPAIESVEYDRAGQFRVNGKPFFPILLYGAPTDDATLAELREFGFNVLSCRAEESTSLPARGFYGAVHGGKVQADPASVFLGIGTDSPALYYKKNLLEQTAAANAMTAAGIPNRPIMNAIGYWEDEPAGVVAGKLPSREVYEDLVVAIDVSAPYLYPVPYQSVASVGEAVARARKATGGKKPLLPILQLFAWEKDARYPTPAELRCMTYLALVEGATGIGFYTYSPVTGQPKGTTIATARTELWQSVKQLNREIAELVPLYLDDSPPSGGFRLIDSSSGIKLRSCLNKSHYPKVLVNSTATKQNVKLTNSVAGFSGRITLADGRIVPVAGGVAEFSLEPFEVVIIRSLESAK